MIDFHDLCRRFLIPGDLVGCVPYGTGHINQTFAATFNQGGTQLRYLLQRLNTDIFQDPRALMANLANVTGHIRGKLEASGAQDITRRVLTLVPLREGDEREGPWFLDDPELGFWRCYVFIEGAHTYDVLEREKQAFEAAKAFGRFQHLLMDFRGPRLSETIPGFHNTPGRLAVFKEAVAKDPLGRAASVRREIDQVLAWESLASSLVSLQASGAIPERITHNDTKINNVMLDDVTGEGICVLDLDTVMPGLSLYDFGDMVRTACNPVAEDEPDCSKVVARSEVFEALVQGYLLGTAGALLPVELDHLVVAGQLLTYECGVRFLADHLMGDTYFRTHRPDQNLDRARTQFALVRSLTEQEPRLMKMIPRVHAPQPSL
jgi:hypothetical protein